MKIFFLDIACALLIVSSISATIILSFQKWGLIAWYEIHLSGRPIHVFKKPTGVQLPKSICIFCLGFWTSVAVVTVLYFMFNLNAWYMLIPFASASITRLIYENALPKER